MSDEQLIKTPGVFGENGNFLLERELGSGGMGGVYMGRDKMLDRPVAVKVMLKEYGSDEAFVEKFKKEAQAAARLIHPNIAQIYSYGISEGMPYIAMELVAGGSLDGLMKVQGKTIDVPRVMKICEQVAQALRCAADQGLVHGDVKPENVLLDANGNAKLVDFGLAAMQKDTDEIWGTPYYIAPEKVKKEPVDYRADMYSLGGTIYHALTGVAPFEGDDAAAVVRKRFEGPAKKPSEVRPGLSPQIDFLVMKMLALNPADRYPSFEALLEDFKKVMTTGLASTQSMSVAAAASMGAAMSTSRTTTSSGGKKLTIKPKKKFKVNNTSTVSSLDEGDVPEMGENGDPADGGVVRHKTSIKRFNTRLANTEDGETAYDDEESGGVGGKVALVIGGVILVIGLVIGGLFGLQALNAQGNAKEVQARVEKGYSDVSKNFALVTSEIERYRTKIAEDVTNAVEACESKTKQIASMMNQVYPAEYGEQLKPPKSEVLLKAEASLLPPAPEPEAPEAGAAQAAGDAATPAAAAPAAVAAAPAPAVKRFRAPVDDEADPNSPAGQDYLKAKAAWEAEQAKAKETPAPAPEAEPAAEAGEDGEAKPVRMKPAYADRVVELWNSVYEAQAALIEVNKRLDKISQTLDDNRAALTESDKTDDKLQKLNSLQQAMMDEFKMVKGSPEAEKISKIGDVVKTKGGRWVRDCTENVRMIRQEENQKAAEAAEEARRKKVAEDTKKAQEELIANEVAAAKELYQNLCAREVTSLNWKDALKQLKDLKAGFKSGPGGVQVDDAIKNIQRMADVQAILQRNLKGYVFKKKLAKDAKVSSITGFTVVDVSDEKISVVMINKQTNQPKGKPKEISWRRIYRDYHENFGELINTFIRKGTINGNPKLQKRERANAMLGVGLTLHLICSDDATSAEYAENIVKEAVKDFPAIRDDAQALFPDIDFSTIDEAEKAADL